MILIILMVCIKTKIMSEEIFKDIPGYEKLYQVSNLGNVKSLDRVYTNKTGVTKNTKGKIMSPNIKKSGYLTIMFSVNGMLKRFYIHRLVSICFIENTERKPHVNHKNGIKNDNEVENLEWVTNQENVQHAMINGLVSKGEDYKTSKLTNKKVLSIRRLYKINPKFNKLALSRKLNVCDTTIHKVIRNKRWKHIQL